jgi:hypothetical protein
MVILLAGNEFEGVFIAAVRKAAKLRSDLSGAKLVIVSYP